MAERDPYKCIDTSILDGKEQSVLAFRSDIHTHMESLGLLKGTTYLSDEFTISGYNHFHFEGGGALNKVLVGNRKGEMPQDIDLQSPIVKSMTGIKQKIYRAYVPNEQNMKALLGIWERVAK